MIKIKNIGKYMALAGCLAFASCSKDDDNVPSVSFPELQTIECEVNSTADISFESTGNWKLSSSSLWCQFVVDGEQMHSCQGKAGKQTVKLMVTGDAAELMKSYTANITLEIDGQEKVIYKVTRPVVGYELHVMDVAQEKEFSAGNPVMMLYNGSAKFTVSANCTWALVSAPDWVTAKNAQSSDVNYNGAVCGTEADVIIANADITTTFQYLPREGELVFKSEDGQKTVTVPVVYDGMPEDEVDFSLAMNNRYNWTFSADGFTLSSGSDMGTVTTMDAPMKIGVWAKNQAYECVALVKSEYGYSELQYTWPQWYYVDNSKDSETESHIEISVSENTGAARYGCVLVLPKAVYDKIGGRYDDYLYTSDWMDIKPEYAKYIAFDFAQEAPGAGDGGFIIKDNQMWEDLPASCLRDMTQDYSADALQEMYGTPNVWMLSTDRPYASLGITPKGFTGSFFEASTIFNGVDTKYPKVEFEPTDASLSMSGWDATASGEMTIIFRDGDTGEIFAVLIVSSWFE